ncbi:MAG: phosphate-starvation-inducible PsiE family protein [Candidatus Acidiferrales bacterium]
MPETKMRMQFGGFLAAGEVVIYAALAILLFATALATIGNAGKMLWESLSHWSIATDTLAVLDQLLLVLMLVEILHTVRISIHSHVLVTEPFLVVGLIASIRRMLVITLEAASLTKGGIWSADGASIFRGNMVELGLLGLLILILVLSIALLRRYAPTQE